MTKEAGKKHFQREDHKHAAHQAEAAPRQHRDATEKPRSTDREHAERDSRPANAAPKGARKGQ